jgi:hypothetical protein
MTLQQIEIDGIEYPILHFKFAINNPKALVYMENDMYFADISGIKYALGSIESDGSGDEVCQQIGNKIKDKE